jgi:hypothetical protein
MARHLSEGIERPNNRDHDYDPSCICGDCMADSMARVLDAFGGFAPQADR